MKVLFVFSSSECQRRVAISCKKILEKASQTAQQKMLKKNLLKTHFLSFEQKILIFFLKFIQANPSLV